MSSIRADIELNAAPFLGGIAKVQRQMRNLQAAAAAITGVFFAARAAMAGMSGVLNQMKGALDLGGKLSDLSAATGASVSELVVLRQALANAGMGADAAGPMIARFQRALAGVNEDGVTTRGVLEELGINTLALSRMPLQDQFTELSRVISAISDPTDRAAAAIKLFGRSGVELLAFLRDPAAFSTAAAQVGELGGVLEQNADRFDSVSDAIQAMGLKFDQFFVGFMSKLDGLDAFEDFSKVDFTGLGQSAGQAAASIAQLISSLRGLLPVFIGVGTATLAFKLGISQAAITAASRFPAAMAAMAASMASPRAALVALGATARATFTGMVTAARAAAAGIKAALVSTGIGLAVVGAAELLAFAMGQRDKVNEAARGEKGIIGETSRMARRYGTSAQAISSPEDQAQVVETLDDEIERAREQIASLDEAFPSLGSEELAQFEVRLRERIATLEALKDMAANIAPEIMEANAQERRRGEALAESKRRAEELARELERALETRDRRSEQAALDEMSPDAAARAVLDRASIGNPEQVDFVLNASGLESLEAARTQIEALERARQTELRLTTAGLPGAKEMLRLLDTADSETIALALDATGAQDAEELRVMLAGLTQRKVVDILLRTLGADDVQEARERLDVLLSGSTDITFDADSLVTEIERLRSIGTEATDAEKQRLFQLLAVEEQLLAVQKRQTDEEAKQAEQQARLAELRREMLLDAEQIAAEAAGDTERVRAIDVEKRAGALSKQLEEQGQDPVTAAELGRKQAELEQLRRELGGTDRSPVEVADSSRQVGLGGRVFGEDRKPQEEMVRKQAESNRLLAEIRSLLANPPQRLLAEAFD